MSPKKKKASINKIKRTVRKFFQTMSDDTLVDNQREDKLDELRSDVDCFSIELLLKAAKAEEKTADTFVYKLFLKQILIMRKL